MSDFRRKVTLKMYSLYPRWRNDYWFKERDYRIQKINPFHVYQLLDHFKLMCGFIPHPESKRFLSCVKQEEPNIISLFSLAENGSVLAVAFIGYYCYDINQHERLEWFAKLLKFGQYEDFLNMIEPYALSNVDNHISLVHIGRCLIKNIDFISRKIFGIYVNHHLFQFTERSVECYIKQMNRCRKAVDAWTHVGLRFRVVKDIRNLIAKMIWESRNEELYF